MSKPANTSEEFSDDNKQTSPWTMLITILLLVVGLLFTSTLMMDRIVTDQKNGGTSETKWFSWFERSGSADTSSENAAGDQPSAIDNLRQMMSSSGNGARWPKLTLSGLGTSSVAAESFAIINGNHIYPGQTIGKVTLVEVRSHDVIVEFQGEQRILTIPEDE